MPDKDVPCRVPVSLESIPYLAVRAAGTIVTGPRWNDPDLVKHGSVAARQGSTTTPALKRRSLSKVRAGMGRRQATEKTAEKIHREALLGHIRSIPTFLSGTRISPAVKVR